MCVFHYGLFLLACFSTLHEASVTASTPAAGRRRSSLSGLLRAFWQEQETRSNPTGGGLLTSSSKSRKSHNHRIAKNTAIPRKWYLDSTLQYCGRRPPAERRQSPIGGRQVVSKSASVFLYIFVQTQLLHSFRQQGHWIYWLSLLDGPEFPSWNPSST